MYLYLPLKLLFFVVALHRLIFSSYSCQKLEVVAESITADLILSLVAGLFFLLSHFLDILCLNLGLRFWLSTVKLLSTSWYHLHFPVFQYFRGKRALISKSKHSSLTWLYFFPHSACILVMYLHFMGSCLRPSIN